MSDIRHSSEIKNAHAKNKDTNIEDFVLEKNIFNNIFEKDIKRVFIYKKAERIAKALRLIAPAFAESVSLKNRVDALAIALVDAAIESSVSARSILSRELLALSSILSMARTGGMLSAMNTEIVAHEARALLHEVAAYEEPRILLEEVATLSEMVKNVSKKRGVQRPMATTQPSVKTNTLDTTQNQEQIKDTNTNQGMHIKDRRDVIMSVIKNKGSASIKDISILIRDVSEKTIQRELISLINEGVIVKKGDRRWSTYSLG